MPSPNETTVAKLEPQLVWRIFAGLADTPRPSKQETAIRRHVIDFAAGNNLVAREDTAGNVIVTVPASSGQDSAPTTVLQAHLDMVCEKNRGTAHDFDNDAIKLIVDEDTAGERIVRADGTTLGADNGIGVAMALAAALDPEVKHGPLELLFTIDEEDGMTGAKALTPESFTGRQLLNLDSEEDTVIYIGCAGGCDTNLDVGFATASVTETEALRVAVRGLRGGHSGCDIHENRGNAIKMLAAVLSATPACRIAEIHGGSKRNAIPREASALVAGPAGTFDALRAAADRIVSAARHESAEPEAVIDVTAHAAPAQAITAEDSTRLVALLGAVPHGVLGMSQAIPGLVQTSNNLATVASITTAHTLRVTLGTLSRSSSTTRIGEACAQIAAVGHLVGATVETANEYPGWEPDPRSAILATCAQVYESLFGTTPDVTAIHAGLECGIIGQRVGDVDMVSFGPRIEGAHSPDERVYVDSVGKSWRYLIAVLAALAT